MCQRCDGFSEEEVERGYDLTIKVDGYVRIQVESAGQPAWAYTMGLNEQFGHPDLICVQVSADLQRQLSFTVGQQTNVLWPGADNQCQGQQHGNGPYAKP